MVKKIFKIKVFPNSPETKIVDVMDDETIRINLHAAAQEGKANQELIRFLSKKFRISSDNIKILSGKTSRQKLIQFEMEKPLDLNSFNPKELDVH